MTTRQDPGNHMIWEPFQPVQSPGRVPHRYAADLGLRFIGELPHMEAGATHDQPSAANSLADCGVRVHHTTSQGN
jgi:hypothetical protein